MKTNKGAEVYLHLGTGWKFPCHFIAVKRGLSIHWICTWVGTKASMDTMAKRKKIPAHLESNETYKYSQKIYNFQNECYVSTVQCHLQKHKHLPIYMELHFKHIILLNGSIMTCQYLFY